MGEHVGRGVLSDETVEVRVIGELGSRVPSRSESIDQLGVELLGRAGIANLVLRSGDEVDGVPRERVQVRAVSVLAVGVHGVAGAEDPEQVPEHGYIGDPEDLAHGPMRRWVELSVSVDRAENAENSVADRIAASLPFGDWVELQ